jgi:SAM-dependent methyltransferase
MSLEGSFDPAWARQYRHEDEVAVGLAGSYKHYSQTLSRLTGSKTAPIDVLDVGCGTGRYFHCLRNLRRLVGIDTSAHMLAQARNPIHREDIGARSLELICGDMFSARLAVSSFDFIYSIGVLGEYAPLDMAALVKLKSLLKSGGTLFVTAVDAGSRVSVPESGQPPLIRRIARKAFPHLPRAARIAINRHLSPCYVIAERLRMLFRSVGFPSTHFKLTPYVHTSGWRGTHWDCLASLPLPLLAPGLEHKDGP